MSKARNRSLIVSSRGLKWNGEILQPGDEFDLIELSIHPSKAKQLFQTDRIVYGDIKRSHEERLSLKVAATQEEVATDGVSSEPHAEPTKEPEKVVAATQESKPATPPNKAPVSRRAPRRESKARGSK